MPSTKERATAKAASSDRERLIDGAESLINGALAELKTAVAADTEKFFPNGIELISVEVKVLDVSVTLKVAGPKAPNPFRNSQPELAGTV
jgi:hypothetical protein